MSVEAMPSAIRAASEEADRLSEQLAAQFNADHGLTTETPAVEEGGEVAPEATVSELLDSPEPEAKPPSVNDVLVHTPKVAEEKASDPSYWARRFDTLLGKYNAEVPSLHSKVKQLEAALAEAKARPALPVEDITSLERQATDAMLEGDVEKAAELRARIYGQVAETARADASKEVANVRKETAEQRFWADLNRARPDWEDINADPGFLQWLAETDSLTGKTRQSFLDEAQGAKDALAVARIFSLWGNGKHQQTEELVAKPTAPSLDKQVVPSRSATATPSGQGGKRVYTSVDVERAYTAIRKGEVDQATAERLQADIDLAIAEGRYRP
jgi:hypothetical protein